VLKERPTILAISNGGAGSSDDAVIAETIEYLHGVAQVTHAVTSGVDELDAVLDDHPELDGVVVLGGDGSLHAVLQAAMRSDRLADVWFGLIPLGTGNDFARTVHVPDDPHEAARLIATGSPRCVDLAVTADGEVVVNAIHVGVGADAAASAAPWKRFFGPVGYAVGAVIAALTRPGVFLEVTVDDTIVSPRRKVLQVAAGNGRYVGGGAPLLPKADPSDGLLDIAVVSAVSRPRRLMYALRLRRGGHSSSDDVRFWRGREVTVRGDRVRATNDGELAPPSDLHAWRVLPGAWRVIVPDRT